MRYQVFILSTVIIIAFLYVFYSYNNYVYFSDIDQISYNLENEIKHIWKNFNKTLIDDYITIFSDYLSSYGYSISYKCVSTENVGIKKCNGKEETNCCYYYDSTRIIELSEVNWECKSNSELYPYKDWFCMCYKISKEYNTITKLFCI